MLVPRSGFTNGALKKVAATNGKVFALKPEIVTRDGEPVITRLYMDQLILAASSVSLTLAGPSGTQVDINTFS